MLRDLFSLFPAHAGVILNTLNEIEDISPFPRTCGGDPQGLGVNKKTGDFSPHMRG